MRLHLFEFEDLHWFPEPIRSGATDYLRFLLEILRFYEPAATKISELIQKSEKNQIVDLCSGGGGPIQQISKQLPHIRFILTDKFPNVKSWKYIEGQTSGSISYHHLPVNAFKEKINFPGARTIFSAAHHFKPEQLKQLIKNITGEGHPLCFFDGGNKNPLMILALLLTHPVLTIATAPFLKPFRLSRLFFTWLIPLIPLVTVWDGFVSIIRLYKPEDLLKLAEVAAPGYVWQAGYIKSKYGLKIAFLSGYSPGKEADTKEY